MDSRIFIALIAVAGLIGMGYFLIPRETIETQYVNETYVGPLDGTCECYLNESLGDSPAYDGELKGYFYGLIRRQGESRYANITILGGNFNGKIYGKYAERQVNGTIAGQGNIRIAGYIETREARGFVIESWVWAVGGFFLLLAVLRFWFPEAVAVFVDKLTGYKYRRVDELQLEEEIREILKNKGFVVRRFRRPIRWPEVSPVKIDFLIECANNENIIVSYERGKTGLPIRDVNENEIRLRREAAMKFKRKEKDEDKKLTATELLRMQRQLDMQKNA